MLEVHRSGRSDEVPWVTAVDPTPEERQRLRDEHGVPDDRIADALDQHELARVDESARAPLVVIRVPVFAGHGEKVPFTTVPLGIVLGTEAIVAISACPSDALRDLDRWVKERKEATPPHVLLLRGLQAMAESYLETIRRIDELVDGLEERLQQSLENREVLELLKCQKSFVYFATALRGTEHLFERLRRGEVVVIPESEHALLDDVEVEVRQAIDMASTSRDVLGEMMDAFASIISNNLNRVMKFLAAATVVLMLPTLIASYWGMNVDVPFAHRPFAFAALVAGSLLGAGLLWMLFRRARWL